MKWGGLSVPLKPSPAVLYSTIVVLGFRRFCHATSPGILSNVRAGEFPGDCWIMGSAPSPLLRDIDELTTFIGKVAFLAEEEEYILCTDGGREEKLAPAQALFRDNGKITAGAAIVAPCQGCLRVFPPGVTHG